MAYSNRPSRRPDPTVAPSYYDQRTGVHTARAPFTPSPYEQKRREARALARQANRKGYRGVTTRSVMDHGPELALALGAAG